MRARRYTIGTHVFVTFCKCEISRGYDRSVPATVTPVTSNLKRHKCQFSTEPRVIGQVDFRSKSGFQQNVNVTIYSHACPSWGMAAFSIV